jgi:hypothetical protein
MNALITALNGSDFRAFPCKSNPKRTTLSFRGEDGKRYFITRVATNQVDAQGKAIYMWATGQAMRDIVK